MNSIQSYASTNQNHHTDTHTHAHGWKEFKHCTYTKRNSHMSTMCEIPVESTGWAHDTQSCPLSCNQQLRQLLITQKHTPANWNTVQHVIMIIAIPTVSIERTCFPRYVAYGVDSTRHHFGGFTHRQYILMLSFNRVQNKRFCETNLLRPRGCEALTRPLIF